MCAMRPNGPRRRRHSTARRTAKFSRRRSNVPLSSAFARPRARSRLCFDDAAGAPATGRAGRFSHLLPFSPRVSPERVRPGVSLQSPRTRMAILPALKTVRRRHGRGGARVSPRMAFLRRAQRGGGGDDVLRWCCDVSLRRLAA